MYLLMADVIIVIHFLFIAFVVGGGLIVRRYPRCMWLHVPAACWGAVIEFGGWVCPLTPLENYLRRLGGQGDYQGDFIVRYLVPVIYPSNLTPVVQYVLGGLVIAVNLFIYVFIIGKKIRSGKRNAEKTTGR